MPKPRGSEKRVEAGAGVSGRRGERGGGGGAVGLGGEELGLGGVDGEDERPGAVKKWDTSTRRARAQI